MTTNAELRALAEAVKDTLPITFVIHDEEMASYLRAATPARVLALLDRIDALERVAKAAREATYGMTPHHLRHMGQNKLADIADALAALDAVQP